MKRKISAYLTEWKKQKSSKPLMILGCRQVGKTYSVREFISENYESFLEINLEREPKMAEIFNGDLDARSVIDRLLIVSGKELTPGKSAIFIDEIQSSQNALSSLKWLAEDGRFDIIVSGSYLGTRLQEDDERISPMGYVTVKTMYPMDFEEFMWAMGTDERMIDSVRKSIADLQPLDSVFNEKISNLFRRYLVVGGMPEAVKTYSETGNYVKTREVIKDIITILNADVGRYSKRTDRMKILSCIGSIPSQLASDKRRFEYSAIEKKIGLGKSQYGDALEWLISSGMAYRCYNLRGIIPPLSQNVNLKSFKMYLCDTGILLGLMDDADVGAIVSSDPFANNGIVMENAVACSLIAKGYPLYYYAKENSTLEIDFVLNTKEIDLIEVKSGRNKRSKSLNTLLAEKDRKRRGFKVCDNDISVGQNGAVHLPLYGTWFLPDSSVPDID